MSQRTVDFPQNREDLKENQGEIAHLLTIFSKKSYLRMQSKNRANYSEVSNQMTEAGRCAIDFNLRSATINGRSSKIPP